MPCCNPSVSYTLIFTLQNIPYFRYKNMNQVTGAGLNKHKSL
ncbi:hypothetical protein B4145_0283 [Bacillus subtilis]|uniref:Uncharacterized protein n=1 Tax=Bacillus subtilis subsp. subtilis TaxID=135461 RepID=A0ABD4A0E0_BACIU|nr:hypothetical protein B4067_0298 [Bacillus subtilis subsp. subtilis]KIN59257.1 hypothetical protein B4145_0283 [Bacillus subtilis]